MPPFAKGAARSAGGFWRVVAETRTFASTLLEEPDFLIPLTLTPSHPSNGMKLSRGAIVSNPSLERLDYPQMPLCGTSGLA